MKRLKSLKIFACLATFLLPIVFSLMPTPQKALAATALTASKLQVEAMGCAWVNVEEIDCTVNSSTTSTAKLTTLKFINVHGLYDYWNSYSKGSPSPYAYDTNGSGGTGDTCGGNDSYIYADPYYPNEGQSIEHATVWTNVSSADTTGAPNCQKVNFSNGNITIATTANADIYYEFSGDNIVRVDGNSSYTFVPSGDANVFINSSEQSASCPDTIVYNSGGSGTLYGLSASGSGSQPPASVHAASNCSIDAAQTVTDITQPNNGPLSPCNLLGPADPCSSTAGINNDGTATLHISGTPPSAPGVTGANTATSPQKTSPDCTASGFSLSWIVCPVIEGISSAEGKIENIVTALLRTKPIDFNPNTNCDPSSDPNCSNEKLSSTIYNVWSNFRIYGNILLVIALLVIIFGESIGGGLIDAYTAKKILPRILAAAILINLSIYIVAVLEDVTNILAAGINEIIRTPFQSLGAWNIHVSGGTGDLAGFAIGAGALAGIAGGSEALAFLALFVALPVLLAVIGVLVTILLRQGILIFLLFVSPLAFALWCLPNTEQAFKRWWDLLFKTLMVYPIVAIVFAMANVTGVIMSGLLGSSTDPGTQLLDQLMGIGAVVAPLFLIPYAFKMSGGAIGAIHETASNFGKRTSEAIKGNPNNPDSLRNKTKRRLNERATRTQSRLIGTRNYRGARRLVSKTADLFGNADSRLAGFNEAAAKRRDTLTNFGNDDLVFAGAGYELGAGQAAHDSTWTTDAAGNRISLAGTTSAGVRHFNSKGRLISSDMYHKGKSLYGGSQHDVTQGSAYTIYKAQTDNDVAAMQHAFNMNAEADNWTDDQIVGNWLGATYPYKGQFGSVRYSVPERVGNNVVSPDLMTDDGAYRGMLKDLHKTRQSYQLGQVRDQDWALLHSRQQQLEQRVMANPADAQAATDLAMTYEIFDAASQTYGARGGGEEGGTPEGAVSATGASAAAQGIITSAVRDRGMRLVTTDNATHEKALVENMRGGAGPARTFTTGIRTEGPDIT